ncbi:MAG: long-chain fatty acid--CoA ligase [Deltaproteobacteria bacterium]|nr:long-chain fatty acid--CoA ligase [Deltaproteobacteria bacterium]
MFLSQVRRYGDRVLYRFARDGQWESYTWNEAGRQVREIGLGLLALEAGKGQRVAIFSANRVEWSLIDWANICVGALTVPIYASSSPAQVSDIVDHSGAAVLFVESADRLAKLDVRSSPIRSLKKIVVIDPAGAPPLSALEGQVISLAALRELGRRYGETHDDLFERVAGSLGPDDYLTIIYTSGTTGEPKGVLTCHRHYLFMIDAVSADLYSTDQDVNLQFLPFAHSFGRLEHFIVVAKGYTCGFARSMETIAKDLLIVQPTLLFSVPRIYENAYSRIRARAAASGRLRKELFRFSLAVGKRVSACQREGKRMSFGLRVARRIAHRLVYAKVHAAFGGRLRLAVSGGAPLAPEIAEFFHALGILILEGYGLTETSTVSHVNRADRYRFGTVGLPLDGVECRIGGDGEILLRGPNTFEGYYRDPEATAEAIDQEGWLHTGDIGEIDGEGFLRITDRKKDLIVTSGGKKVAPQIIENLLKSDPLFSQVMVIGDRKRHLMALVTLNQEQIREWGKGEGIEFRSAEEMASHPRVHAVVKERIRRKNKTLAPFETVRGFRILAHEFSVERGELTPTLKVRRQIVMERYRDLIENVTHREGWRFRPRRISLGLSLSPCNRGLGRGSCGLRSGGCGIFMV